MHMLSNRIRFINSLQQGRADVGISGGRDGKGLFMVGLILNNYKEGHGKVRSTLDCMPT